MDDSLIGRTIGNYRVHALVGRGGMATVYQAHDESGHAVALKVLNVQSCTREAGEQFAREALWLASCADPHIVPVFAAGSDGDLQYIAMELLPQTLQNILHRRPGVDQLVEIGAGILLGLYAAHRLGVLHGDLKPANVGIGRDGTIKLLDFGAANPLPWNTQLCDGGTHPMMLGCIGTLQYLAPEHLRGDSVDERADVYGAGAVLYEVATGRPPFADPRPACLIDAILNRTPPPPSSRNRRLSRAVDEVVLRALAKRPSMRFRSVHAMMDALLAARISSEPARICDDTWRGDAPARFRVDAATVGARALGR
jgi:eukaryotic-like serine/threonine-protein kinase